MLLLDFNSLFVRFSISLSLSCLSLCLTSRVQVSYFRTGRGGPPGISSPPMSVLVYHSPVGVPPWTAGRPRHPTPAPHGATGLKSRAGRCGRDSPSAEAAFLRGAGPFVDLRGTLLNIAASSQAVCSGGSSSSSSSGAAAHSWKLPRSRS